MRNLDRIAGAIGRLGADTSRCWLSDSLQVADLLEYVLEYTGPADVDITSFSLSEEFLRRLFFLRKRSGIRRLRIVLDYKATNKTLLLWPFIAHTVEHCYLADNHSKILCVRNDSHRVAAVMSQNLTRGNRFEAGAVFSDHPAADGLGAAIDSIITNHSVPFTDVFARRIDPDRGTCLDSDETIGNRPDSRT